MFSRNVPKFVLAIIMTITLAGAAYSQWRTNGDLDQESPAQKAVGDFGTMLMITDDPDGLFEAWAKPPSPEYGPSISEASTAHRGGVVLAFVIFSGCAENADGNCDADVEYTAYFPDGSVYGQHSGALWVGFPDPGKGSLQLSEGNLGLRIEPDDPFGIYRITADIIDNVSGTEISLSTEITVVASE